MEFDAILLGLLMYLLLVGLLIIVNEAFCKSACLKNARRIQNEEAPDVELNERDPKPVTRPPRKNGKGDAASLSYVNDMYAI